MQPLYTAVVLMSIAACSHDPHSVCPFGEQREIVDSLYFGSARGEGVVTREEWQAFVDELVTPRFAQGFTILDARGQYRTAQGEIQREPAWVLQLVHAEGAASEAAIREIRTAYQTRFKQEAVLRVRQRGCVSF